DPGYDHGVLHRAPSSEGAVRTPRLVSFDTRDALGSLNPLGIIGGLGAGASATSETAQAAWAGGVSVFRQPPRAKNALHVYLDAEDDGPDGATSTMDDDQNEEDGDGDDE
ncbi:unnamed protein product, partial [Sphacelaria rigidula]